LDVDLRAETDGARARLMFGEVELATAERAELSITVPAPPNLAEAVAAEARFDQSAHVYPGCFVCGPNRDPGDGWRIFPGPIAEDRVAASWTPAAEFADESGAVRPEFVWAALDCPGYFAVQEAAGLALLGRMGVVIHRPVPVETHLVIQGWGEGSEGRKHHAGTAIHDAAGELLAAASQTWVTLR
jgi:hypothetical protein